MEIYCLPEFKKEYEKLCKKDSYSNLTQEIIDCFLGKKFTDCLTGKNLNQSVIAHIIKETLAAGGGFRLYYLALTQNEKVYFGYIHPKTGSMGSSNTTNDFRRQLVKDMLKAIEDDTLLKVTLTEKAISFKKIE